MPSSNLFAVAKGFFALMQLDRIVDSLRLMIESCNMRYGDFLKSNSLGLCVRKTGELDLHRVTDLSTK